MKRGSQETTFTFKNPNINQPAEDLEEESVYITFTDIVDKTPATTSDKKFLSIIKPFLPVAVCWGTLLVIMALRIHFTSVISTKLSNEMENSNHAFQNLSEVITANENLKRDHSNLIVQRDNLTVQMDILTVQRDNLTVQRDNLTKDKAVLSSNIKNVSGENQQLKAEIQKLKEEIQRLKAENQSTITPTPILNVTQQNWMNTTTERNCEPCQTGWFHFQASCYVIGNQSTWEEARDDCRSKKADLVVIESPDEQKFISNITRAGLGTSGYWIGLRAEAGSWQWVDGSDLTKDSGMQQPADGHHCGISVRESNGWKAVNCDVKNGWICEKKALSKF